MSFVKYLGGLPSEQIKTLLSLHDANCDSDSSDDGKSELDEKYYANKQPPIADDQLLANVVRLTTFANLVNSSEENVKSLWLQPTVDGIKTSNSYELLQVDENVEDGIVKEKETAANIWNNENKAPPPKKSRKIKKEKKPKKIKTKNRRSTEKYIPVFTDKDSVATYCSYLLTSSSTGCAPQSVLLNFPCLRNWRKENPKFSDRIKHNFLDNIMKDVQTNNPLMPLTSSLFMSFCIDMPFFDLYRLILTDQQLSLVLRKGNTRSIFTFK